MISDYRNNEIAWQHYAALESEARLHRLAREATADSEPLRTTWSDFFARIVRSALPHRRSLRPAIRSV